LSGDLGANLDELFLQAGRRCGNLFSAGTKVTLQSNQIALTGETAMHMSAESLLVILLIGAIAGWLAGQIVQGTGFGLLCDIIIGIVGAFIASWLFPQLGFHLGAGIVAEIIAATIGAVLLLVIMRLVRRRGRW
jgi:uncharacterized membrane protein YeaQ/YmgE (transglycosylase-associated protein family)